MIETCSLKNFVTFIQIILSFVLLRKIKDSIVIETVLVLRFRSFCLFFFFYLGFISRTFTNHRTAREGGGHSINSSLPLPPALQTLRCQPDDYCRELTSAHSEQPDSNPKPLVSERKSLTTKLVEITIDRPKLCLSTKFPHQEIRRNFGILLLCVLNLRPVSSG